MIKIVWYCHKNRQIVQMDTLEIRNKVIYITEVLLENENSRVYSINATHYPHVIWIKYLNMKILPPSPSTLPSPPLACSLFVSNK